MKHYTMPNADLIYFETQDIMTGSNQQQYDPDPADPFATNPWGGVDLTIPQ